MIRQSLAAIRQHKTKGGGDAAASIKVALAITTPHPSTPPSGRPRATQEPQQTMRGIAALAVASLAVGLASGQTRACENNSFIEVGGECLAFLPSYGTWYNQLEACVIAGGSLAKVTGDLHNAIYQQIVDSHLTDKCFWIGGSDRLHEGQWKWEYDQSDIPLGGPHWDPCETEPDGGATENYLAICPSMYYFKDYPADFQHHAICQLF